MKRLKIGKLLGCGLSAVFLGLVVAELFSRFVLGLGTPPLTVTDPHIEYLFAPHQEVRRFGNRFATNAFSMRSPPFHHRKSDPREIRVLVIGDSVVNGGALTDQSLLATSIALDELASRNVSVVGNISAGSWGPANHLAYVKAYGLFDADIVIFVYSSHDFFDIPTFRPLDPLTSPTSPPLFAVQEGFQRYFLRKKWRSYSPPARSRTSPVQDAGPNAERDILELYDLVLGEVNYAHCILWPDREEAISRQAKSGREELRELALDRGLGVTDIADTLTDVEDGAIQSLYRDGIHPTDDGQRLLATVICEIVEHAIDVHANKQSEHLH